jgi:hypothetical protein
MRLDDEGMAALIRGVVDGPVQLRIQNDLGGVLDVDQLITTTRVDRVMSRLIVQMPVRLIREGVVCGVQGRTRVCFRDLDGTNGGDVKGGKS